MRISQAELHSWYANPVTQKLAYILKIYKAEAQRILCSEIALNSDHMDRMVAKYIGHYQMLDHILGDQLKNDLLDQTERDDGRNYKGFRLEDIDRGDSAGNT